jgi:hypothetical protein
MCTHSSNSCSLFLPSHSLSSSLLSLLIQMIDSMAEAIKQFNGGVVVISHDFR